jgi:hypothetical protein
MLAKQQLPFSENQDSAMGWRTAEWATQKFGFTSQIAFDAALVGWIV